MSPAEHGRVAVTFTPTETRREVIVEVAIEAERLGFAAFFVAEGWAHDAVVILTEISGRTERITLGAGVLNVWSRSAGLLAMAAASLQEASGGRFVLGLGASSPQLVEGLHDRPFRGSTTKLRQIVEQTRTLLDGRRIELSTESTERALKLGLPPAVRVPIYVAGLGPASIRLAGEIADGWYPFLYPLQRIPAGRVKLIAARRPGQRPAEICPLVPTFLDDDPDRARAAATEFVAFYLTRMGSQYRTSLTRLGHRIAVAAALSGDRSGLVSGLADCLTVHGTPEQARGRVACWHAAGASMPVLTLPAGGRVEDHVATLRALRPRTSAEDLLAAR